MGWSARSCAARVVIRPIRGHARCAGHPRFGNSRAHPLRPVDHPDRRPRQERRFLESSLRQPRFAGLSEGSRRWRPATGRSRGSPKRRRSWSDTDGCCGLIVFRCRVDDILRRRGFWLDAAVAPDQPRRVRGGGQHTAQRAHETPDQEGRYRDELQFGNHDSRLLRKVAVHTSSRLRDFGGPLLDRQVRRVAGRTDRHMRSSLRHRTVLTDHLVDQRRDLGDTVATGERGLEVSSGGAGSGRR